MDEVVIKDYDTLLDLYNRSEGYLIGSMLKYAGKTLKGIIKPFGDFRMPYSYTWHKDCFYIKGTEPIPENPEDTIVLRSEL